MAEARWNGNASGWTTVKVTAEVGANVPEVHITALCCMVQCSPV
jgi:hypothetical protein